MPAEAVSQLSYAERVNPQWVRLLDVLNMNVRYERCIGAELFSADGDRYLDFLSGYCVLNAGHNHPHIVAALQDELERCGPVMLQSHVPELAGQLAERLCRLAGGKLKKVFFASSGSEGIESAIKFARASTGRNGMLCAQNAFHGLTCGALSLMDNEFWRDGFGPMLPQAEAVPFNDPDALEEKLRSRRFAAFFVEPIQSEGGIRVPSPQYLVQAQALCRLYGTLLVLDEVQTGMFRTGKFLAAHHYDVSPDIVVLAKALSGGLVPVSAVLMSDEIYDAVYGSLRRAIIHTSTFSENGLAMRAAMAALDVAEDENLGERAIRLGAQLRHNLTRTLSRFEMFASSPGTGLLCGIEFASPASLTLKVPFTAFRAIHPGMFAQMIVMRLFTQEKVLTQVCGNNFMVIKAAPPLVVDEQHIDEFVAAMERVFTAVHSSSAFWIDAMKLGRRTMNI